MLWTCVLIILQFIIIIIFFYNDLFFEFWKKN